MRRHCSSAGVNLSSSSRLVGRHALEMEPDSLTDYELSIVPHPANQRQSSFFFLSVFFMHLPVRFPSWTKKKKKVSITILHDEHFHDSSGCLRIVFSTLQLSIFVAYCLGLRDRWSKQQESVSTSWYCSRLQPSLRRWLFLRIRSTKAAEQ